MLRKSPESVFTSKDTKIIWNKTRNYLEPLFYPGMSGILIRQGADIRLFITLVPKDYRNVFLLDKLLGNFIDFLMIRTLDVQMFNH